MAQPVVRFLWLDAFSLKMAASLLQSGYSVEAYDASEIHGKLLDDFSKLGGKRCDLMEATQGVRALVILISHSDQINSLFDEGFLKGLSKDVVIIVHSTIPPADMQSLEKIIREDYQIENIVDIYPLKAQSEISNGKLMIISSGRSESTSTALPFLSAMGEKVFLFEGEIGAASKIKMVIDLLEMIHIVASLEAMCLGVRAGIHPLIIHDMISISDGNSWIFKYFLPNLLEVSRSADNILGSQSADNILRRFHQNTGVIVEMAKSLMFPLPLLTAAHQQILAGLSHSMKDKVSTVLSIWQKLSGVDVLYAASANAYDPEKLATELSNKSQNAKTIGFIGLGDMGFGMATRLLKSKFTVLGYDVDEPTLSRFEREGGIGRSSPAEVAKDADVLVVMVTNEYEAEIESVLFGDNGAAAALPTGATIILSTTTAISPLFVRRLEGRLWSKTFMTLVDAPVSGGVNRAADGTLTIMASGVDEALENAGSVLSALSEKLYIIEGDCGAEYPNVHGSLGAARVNQLLAGVHIASAAEAMAFGARLGLNTRPLFDAIKYSAATSWMFENRGPHMVEADYTALSALDVCTKDLEIALRESAVRRVPLHVSNVAHQLFISGSASGWGQIDESAVVKVYEKLTGVKVEGSPVP